MQRYTWKITQVLSKIGETTDGQMILGWKLGLKTEEETRYKKHKHRVKDTTWYYNKFTVKELKMVGWLLKELYHNSPFKDAEMLTWKLGDIVYYKPKDL